MKKYEFFILFLIQKHLFVFVSIRNVLLTLLVIFLLFPLVTILIPL